MLTAISVVLFAAASGLALWLYRDIQALRKREAESAMYIISLNRELAEKGNELSLSRQETREAQDHIDVLRGNICKYQEEICVLQDERNRIARIETVNSTGPEIRKIASLNQTIEYLHWKLRKYTPLRDAKGHFVKKTPA